MKNNIYIAEATMQKIAFFIIIFFLIGGCKNIEPEQIKSANEPTGEFIDEWTFRINPKPTDNFDVAEFRLWVPENTENLRAVLVLLNNYNSNGLSLANTVHWQNFAIEQNLAIISVHFRSINAAYYGEASSGSGKALLTALDTLTDVHDLAYISSLPFLLRGYSAGGVFSYYFSQFKPERVLAYANIRGGGVDISSSKNNGVPGIMIIGDLDSKFSINEISRTVLEKRKNGALLSFAIKPNEDHFSDLTESDELVKSFFSIAIPRRHSIDSYELNLINENTGWLGNNTTYEIFNFETYPGSSKDASWLISEEFAITWKKFQSN